jgi:phasin family protein
MAKGPATNFSDQNAQSAMQEQDWIREMTEHSLNQSRSMVEGFLTTTRKAVEGVDHQASELRDRSRSLVQQTLSNTFDFAHKLVHAREPRELLNLQSEFISRQAQVIAEQSKELGESTVRGVHEAGRMAASQGMAESARRGSQAA